MKAEQCGGRAGAALPVFLQPRASRNEVVGVEGGVLKVRVTAPPVGGAANQACLTLVAAFLGVSPSRVRIVRGRSSRRKWLEVGGFSPEELTARLTP